MSRNFWPELEGSFGSEGKLIIILKDAHTKRQKLKTAEAQSSRRHQAAEAQNSRSSKQQKLKTAESQNGRRHKTTEAPFGRCFTNIYAY
jgi:hypothetical protein